jgi:hypothetical protein
MQKVHPFGEGRQGEVGIVIGASYYGITEFNHVQE